MEEIKIMLSGTNKTDTNATDHGNYEGNYYPDLESLKESRFYTLNQIQKYLIPALCALGMMGNLSSAVIFRTRSMRVKSCANYLLTKCVVDNVFLISLFIVWLDRVSINWFHTTGVCQVIVFLTYISGFMSVWMVVMVTVENYVSICRPRHVTRLCNVRNARKVTLLLLIFSIVCYHFPLWTTAVTGPEEKRACSQGEAYAIINESLTYLDTALTLVVPSILIFLFMFSILRNIVELFLKIRRQRNKEQGPHFFCQTPFGQISVMLLAVTAVFMVIHTPSHVGRLYLHFSTHFNDDLEVFLTSLTFQRHFELLYYTNFSINFFIYLIFGQSFRRLYKNGQCCCACGQPADDRQQDSQFDQCVCKSSSRGQLQVMEGSEDNRDINTYHF